MKVGIVVYTNIVAFKGTDRLAQRNSEHPMLLDKMRVESVHDYGPCRLITMRSGDSHYVLDTLEEIVDKVWTSH